MADRHANRRANVPTVTGHNQGVDFIEREAGPWPNAGTHAHVGEPCTYCHKPVGIDDGYDDYVTWAELARLAPGTLIRVVRVAHTACRHEALRVARTTEPDILKAAPDT